jgi:hypothetical protein
MGKYRENSAAGTQNLCTTLRNLILAIKIGFISMFMDGIYVGQRSLRTDLFNNCVSIHPFAELAVCVEVPRVKLEEYIFNQFGSPECREWFKIYWHIRRIPTTLFSMGKLLLTFYRAICVCRID